MTRHHIDPLQERYESRRRRHQAPRAVRELIMNKARRQQQHFWQRFNLLNWTIGVSALSALLLLYQFVTIYLGPNIDNARQLQVVQIHRLNQEVTPPFTDTDKLNKQISILHADNYARYLQTDHIFAKHHSQIAKLISTHNGWQLQTCNDQIVQISQQLVNAMANAHRFEKNIHSGQQVNIQFDQQGRIIGIQSASTPYSC
ncbi:hypothetical protein [Neptunicella sp. SCSIO 80796]|uniref:hypothetical protein n=1 Tax=Neptunicella plasticusilytica TaxID=3117012 RepID=UPI003A4E360D